MTQEKIDSLEAGVSAVFQSLMEACNGPKGVQAEALLCTIGAFGGYACQFKVRKDIEKGITKPESLDEFRAQQLGDGNMYVQGTLINKELYGSEESFLILASVAMLKMGMEKDCPDFEELKRRVATSLGTKYYGRISVPESGKYIGIALPTLKSGWKPVATHALNYCPSEEDLHLLFGLVAERCIMACKDVISPKNALQIVAESAFSMSCAALNLEP